MNKKPFILTILDGWGYSKSTQNNAIAQAKTPCWNYLWNNFPKTLIDCSGKAVGLPELQMGNSEVGHLHIGSGRIIPQALTRINDTINNHELDTIEILKTAFQSKKRIHLLGLLSDGGVHSHEKHFHAFINYSKKFDAEIYIHAFLDGRDTPPKYAERSLKKLNSMLSPKIKLASICGRYFAMDRDRHWDRIQQSYNTLLGNSEYEEHDPLTALSKAYERGETDEFVKPTICSSTPVRITDDDIIIFMNFRADRARQLASVFIDDNFSHFSKKNIKLNNFITLTEYDKTFSCDVLFPPIQLYNTLPETIAKHGLKQLKIAETEKYAHVTYFFNGGIEKAFPQEDRILIQSPRVKTYDLAPEMSAITITDTLIEKMDQYDFIVCNFANADMVGHSGDLNATINAINMLDTCIERLFKASQAINSTMLITADHGNAENMYNKEKHQSHTAHTRNPVPCLITNIHAKPTKKIGSIIDIAPTILTLMSLPIPKEMSGHSLFTI